MKSAAELSMKCQSYKIFVVLVILNGLPFIALQLEKRIIKVEAFLYEDRFFFKLILFSLGK